VLRGGSWNNNWNNLRVANRNNNNPDNDNNNIGFRCVSAPIRFLKKPGMRISRNAIVALRKFARFIPGWVNPTK